MNQHVLIQTRAAPLEARSWDSAARSFEVVFATETPVERRDSRGKYFEVLSVNGMHVASRSLPLLDSHARGSLNSQIGSADNVRVVGGEALATVKLSRANQISDRIAIDLDAGHTFGVSTGYVVNEVKEEVRAGVRYVTATRWTVIEISLVPIPADQRTGIRGQFMPVETQSDPAPQTTIQPAAERAAVTNEVVADRSAINSEIRSIARLASLEQSWIDQQIDRSATVEQARAAAFDAMQRRTAPAAQISTATIGTDYNDPTVRARAMGEALFTRIDPSHTPSEPARAYIGLTLPEMARVCVRAAGVQTTGMSSGVITERALQSTSDFPLILGDTIGRTLRQAYSSAPAGVRRLGRQTTARDFRAKHRLQFSTAPTLAKVNESGEFKSGSMAEAQESYAVETFGRIIGVTRQAIVNDDLGAFADLPRRMGQAAATFENDFLVGLVTGPSVMSDGKTLFHADHGNIGSASVIDPSALSAARHAMRTQKGLLGELIAVTPKYLLVGPDRETEAEMALAVITPHTYGEVNPFSNRLELIVDPRLSDSWYVVADPAEIDGLEYAYLEGAVGPQVTSEVGFDVDGVRFRVRLDFGGGFVDWRGWHMNAGD